MVTEQHRAFARAVVALAREHGMDSLTMSFRPGFQSWKHGTRPPSAYEQVKMGWATGRHGDAGQIEIRTKAMETITEREDVTP